MEKKSKRPKKRISAPKKRKKSSSKRKSDEDNAKFRRLLNGLNFSTNAVKPEVTKKDLESVRVQRQSKWRMRKLLNTIRNPSLEILPHHIKSLLQSVDVNQEIKSGRRLLHECARSSRTHLVFKLIQLGADVNARCDSGWTPLYFCAATKDADPADACLIARMLLTAGATTLIDESANCQSSPLEVALVSGNYGVLEELLAGGADPNEPHPHGLTLLEQAVGDQDLEATMLLLQYGADHFPKWQWSKAQPIVSALHRACKQEYLHIAETLLKMGADPNAQSRRTGRAIIHESSVCGRAQAVELLMQFQAWPKFPSAHDDNMTALELVQQQQKALEIKRPTHGALLDRFDNTETFLRHALSPDLEQLHQEFNCKVCMKLMCPLCPKSVARKLMYMGRPLKSTYDVVTPTPITVSDKEKNPEKYYKIEFNIEGIWHYPRAALKRLKIFKIPFPNSKSGKKKLICAFVKGTETGQVSEKLIFYSQPNAADIGLSANLVMDLALFLKVDFFIYDYNGYGRSSGKPNEKRVSKTAKWMWEYVVNREDTPDPENIFLYGQSVGSMPTCYLGSYLCAKRERKCWPAGVILHSAFASAIRVACPNIKNTCCDSFQNVRQVSGITVPTLVIHGTADQVVPFKNGVQLYEELQCPVAPLWVDGAGHNNVSDYPVYYKRLKQFIYQEAQSLRQISK